MRKNKTALCAAFASLNSNEKILAIRSELERGIEGAFRLGLPFEFDNSINTVEFDDLCLYFSPERDKIILAFIYPGRTVPKELRIPGVNLPYNALEIEEFIEYLYKNEIDFEQEKLNEYVVMIKLNGIVFYFDLTNQDRRIDITYSSTAIAAQRPIPSVTFR